MPEFGAHIGGHDQVPDFAECMGEGCRGPARTKMFPLIAQNFAALTKLRDLGEGVVERGWGATGHHGV
ncbi:hypothetical protein COCCU_05530 [Corynebacterium occultum]|uniref:Uncharacterized protein n=1 Tax=Corynebacterium occultum TaxID=2675219 RepID=A0A6B8VNF1_9CORY|nr:hypothetical protein COCCU_05530 [Corynebacterium occultum]